MDKQLLKAYIRTIVEEEVQRVLPKMLGEAVAEVKRMAPITESATSKKSTIDRGRLAELMGIDYDRQSGTLTATTAGMPLPENAPRDVDPEVVKAVTRDYSQLMKAMKIV